MADTQLVRREEQAARVQQLFARNRDRILKGVPRSIGSDPSRLLSIAYNAVIYDEKLVQCTHVSLLGGVMEALKMGITIGGPMQESWLVPFNQKISKRGEPDKWALVATLIIGYQGYRNIIDRGRATLDMHPRLVHVNDLPDHFDFQFGTQPFIRHKPLHAAPLVEAEVYAAYAVAHLRGGGLQMEVMLKAEIDKHRARSRAKDSGPWANANDYPGMALKTPMRKLAKNLPKSSEILARALDLDERADTGQPQDFELPAGYEVFDEGLVGPGTSARLEALAGAMKADRGEREVGEEG